MHNITSEFINLEHFANASIDYRPTFISTDKRATAGATTSIGYWSIGSNGHQGNPEYKGPVFKMIFADLSNVTTPTHIKIWAIGNDNNDAVEFPISYLTSNPELEVWLDRFEFTDGVGNAVAPDGAYTIIGCKKRGMPITW